MYIGHRTVTKKVEIKSDEDIVLDFQMKQSMIDLDEVVVAASFREHRHLR